MRQTYPTDLSDAEWHLLARLIPEPKPGGRPVKYSRREIVNAILSVLRSGEAWRLLPHDLPAWATVYHYFRRWRRMGHGNASMTAYDRKCAAGTGALLNHRQRFLIRRL